MSMALDEVTLSITSFLAFKRASSSEETGIALDDSETYRFTMVTLSIKDDTFPDSLSNVNSFFLVNVEEGTPKPGPDSRKTGHNT
ncbi:hypothetical protein OROGR_032683 [Orobanche gracilis]